MITEERSSGNTSQKLSMPLPAIKFEKPVDLPKVKLADPNFNQPVEIDMVIGDQLYESLRNGKIINYQGLYLVSTAFGCVISGIVKQTNSKQTLPVLHHVMQEDKLRKSWEAEEVSAPKENFWTYDGIAASKHYDTTTKRITKAGSSLRCLLLNRNQTLVILTNMH